MTREKTVKKKRGDSTGEEKETNVTLVEIQVDGRRALEGGINREKVKDGWKDEPKERSGGTDRHREAAEAEEQPCEV